jgi:ABC-type tungstate transport system substrate-binding protein
MQTILDAFAAAFHLMVSLNGGLMEIVWLSLRVSLTAVACAAVIGLPLGAALALFQFPGRRVAAILMSSLMACRRWSLASLSICCSRARARSASSACSSRPRP